MDSSVNFPRSVLRLGLACSLAVAAGCSGGKSSAPASGGTSSALTDLMKARNLREVDVNAALKTYTPSGKQDEYMVFASGGHSGQVIVIGVPSMRILKYIAVFTPEPWQGYGFDDSSKAVLAGGKRYGHNITWADTHHPALSETGGDYDGQYLFIGDKANARLGVVDLKDFATGMRERSSAGATRQRNDPSIFSQSPLASHRRRLRTT